MDEIVISILRKKYWLWRLSPIATVRRQRNTLRNQKPDLRFSNIAPTSRASLSREGS
jgi:hypothetical protein